MTLRDYWDITRRHWWLIIATTLIGALVAYGVSMLMTPVYQATAQLFVSVRASDTDVTFNGGYYVQQRMKSYVDVVDTPRVLDPVVNQLGLDAEPSVSAQNPTDTVLINVSATHTDPAKASAIANAAAASLANEIVHLETTQTGTKPVNADVIRPAQTPSVPVSPRIHFNVVLGALLGLMIGFGIAVLRATLDTTIRSVDDLVEATGATALGMIAYDSGAPKHPVATMQGSARAEAYRALRTNLKYVDVDQRPRSVVITSSTP